MRTPADTRHFWLRKIHSLTGFVPIGAYLFVHIMFENSMVRFGGPNGAGFNFVAGIFGHDIPLAMLQAIEVVLIGSILFHGVYGLFIIRDSRANVTRYPRARNWMFTLQRLTGVIAFIFIGYHVYTTRLRVYFGMWGWQPDVEVTAAWMKTNIFGHGWVVTTLYVVGVVSSIFHFTNGVWNGLISWGITVGPAAQKVSAYVCTIGGVLMSAFGVWVLFGFQNVV